jgi:hypothetical protein
MIPTKRDLIAYKRDLRTQSTLETYTHNVAM